MSKYLDTMIKKHGSYEAYRKHMAKIGGKGGAKLHDKPHGFGAMTPEQHKSVSSKGGKISRKTIDK